MRVVITSSQRTFGRLPVVGSLRATGRDEQSVVRGAILLWEISTGEKGTEVDRRVVHQRATYAVLPLSLSANCPPSLLPLVVTLRGDKAVFGRSVVAGVCRVLQSSERLLTRNSFPLPPFLALRPLVSVEIRILGRERTENFCKRPPKPTSDHESLVLNGMAHKS